jgi:hypothetical protein
MPSDANRRDRTISRTTGRATSPVTVYRTLQGIWRFTDEPGSLAVEASLADGYRIDVVDGARYIVRELGEPEMTAEEGVRRGILVIPIVQR